MGKLKTLLFAFILSVTSLAGCNNSGDKGGEEQKGGDDEGGGSTPSDIISGLDFEIDEAQNKLKQLGSTQGFEITLEAISQEDDGTTSKESATIGFKVETAWLAGEGAYVMTRNGTETYAYTATSGQYDYVATIDGKYFDDYITTITSMFYIAYSYNSYLDKVGPTTFLGRPATEYKFAGSYATAFANLEIIIDDETGITLKYAGKAQDLDGNAAAGSLVVTAFKTGENVVRPVLNKNGGSQGGEGGQGGGQGEGGDPSVTLPNAGKYSLDANQVRDPGNYANGYFEIDEDGSGVFCDYVGHQYIGTFVNDGSDIVMTATSEAYIPADGTAPRTAACNKTFYFDFLGDASWGIWYEGYHLIYKYDQGQGGDTPTDNLEDALITSAQYASLVTGMAYIGAEGNAKFNRQTKSYQVLESVSTLENDKGNYQHGITYVDANGQDEMTSVMFYAKDAKHEGYYDLYERQADFSWKKSANGPYAYEDQIFAEFAGLQLLSYVPFNSLSEPHFETSPYYSCSKFDYENDGYEVHLTNIKIYFNKGQLVHFSYTSGGYINIDVEITDIGHVSLEIPEGGQQQPETPVQNNALLYGIDGAKFVFDRAEKGGYQGTDFDSLIAALQNCSFNFFSNGNGELVNTNQGINNIYLGTYTLMKAPSSNTGTVRFNMTEQYVNGAINNSFNGDVQVFTYYAQEDELHMIQTGTQNGNAVEIHMIFTRSSTVPTPYDPQGGQGGGGGQQTPESKWPAKDITAKLEQLGFKMSIPSVINEDYLSSVDVDIVDKTLVIKPHFTDNKTITTYSDYSDTSKGPLIKAGYTYKTIDTTTMATTFLSQDQKYQITVSIDMNDLTKDYFTIVASKRVLAPYPEGAVNAYVADLDAEVKLPKFEVEGSEAEFYDGALLITLPEDVSASSAKATFASALKEAGFGEYYIPYDSNSGLYFFLNASDTVMVAIVDGSDANKLTIAISADGMGLGTYRSCPTDDFNEQLPDYLNDKLPNLTISDSKAIYHYGTSDDGKYLLQILPQKGVNVDGLIRNIKGMLTSNGYVGEDNPYIGPNGELSINVLKEGDYGVTVEVTVLAEEPESSEYTLNPTQNWIRDGEAEFYAWVWGGTYGSGQWVRIDVDEVEVETDVYEYVFKLYVNTSALGCKIVRVNPSNEINWDEAGNEVFDLGDDIIWNVTNDISFPRTETGTLTLTFITKY